MRKKWRERGCSGTGQAVPYNLSVTFGATSPGRGGLQRAPPKQQKKEPVGADLPDGPFPKGDEKAKMFI